MDTSTPEWKSYDNDSSNPTTAIGKTQAATKFTLKNSEHMVQFMASIILQFADQGWHIRWNTPDTEEFEMIRERFKNTLPLQDRYWDPEAFNGKGGWWVAYGALAEVGHLFENYQVLRNQLEQPYWQQFEQQQKELREHFAREQESRRRCEQETERQREKTAGQRKVPSREEVTLPTTLAEALALLHLMPPVTTNGVRRAYYAQALNAHSDRGGSHAAMVEINAAYELAIAAC